MGHRSLPNMLIPRITCAGALAHHSPTPDAGLPDPSEDLRPESVADAANAVSTRGSVATLLDSPAVGHFSHGSMSAALRSELQGADSSLGCLASRLNSTVTKGTGALTVLQGAVGSTSISGVLRCLGGTWRRVFFK